MSEQTFTRIIRLVDVVFRILQIGCIVLTVICVISGVAVIMAPDLLVNSSTITIGESIAFTLEDTSEYINASAYARAMAINIFLGAFISLSFFYGMRVARKIIGPMKSGKVFHRGMAAEFRQLGWIVLLCGAFTEIISVIGQYLLIQSLNLDEIVANQSVSNISLNYTFDVTFVLTSLVLFLCAYIFKNGEQLQELDDETL